VLGSAALALRAPAAPAAGGDDRVRAKFEVYKDRGGEFRWRLRATNTQILAISADSYKEKRGALNAIDSVKRDVPGAPVEELTDSQGAGQHDGQAEKGRPSGEPKRGAGSGNAK